MRTLFLATMLISGTAAAQVNIDQALQIRNDKMIVTAPGASIGRIDIDAVKKATAGLNGNVSIQFNKNESLQVNKAAARSGGVIVGSGTNGDKSVVKVNPPLRPQIGVTVTGRSGAANANRDVCAIFLDRTIEKSYESCLNLGAQFRLPHEGRYLLYIEGLEQTGFTSTEVFVKNGDQIIIPLREIQVDAYSELDGHFLSIDLASKDEQRKLRLFIPFLNKYHRQDSEVAIQHASSSRRLFGRVGITYKGENGLAPAFYNVFPGTYAITWIFPYNQYDYTYGIVVE